MNIAPILYLVYNRPDLVEVTFSSIRAARPEVLYICADGPIHGNQEDSNRCASVRNLVREIDWPCHVKFLFREKNLGCSACIIDALDWFFSENEFGIVIEDDCLVHNSFYKYATTLLDKYSSLSRIGMISGSNFLDQVDGSYSYYYSKMTNIWGWATWRDRWVKFSNEMDDWNAERVLEKLDYFGEQKHQQFQIFKAEYSNKSKRSWGVQWRYTCMKESLHSIVPAVNLVRNIGMGHELANKQNSPHIVGNNHLHEMQFPLKRPSKMTPSQDLDIQTLQFYYSNKINQANYEGQ